MQHSVAFTQAQRTCTHFILISVLSNVWLFFYFYKTDRFQSRCLGCIPKIDHYSLIISLTWDSFPLQHCASLRRNALSLSPVLWSGYADCSLSFFLSAVTVNSALLAGSPKLLYEPADYERPRAASWVSVTRPSRLTFSMPSKGMLDFTGLPTGQTHSVALLRTRFFFLNGTYLDHTGYILAYIISWYNLTWALLKQVVKQKAMMILKWGFLWTMSNKHMDIAEHFQVKH